MVVSAKSARSICTDEVALDHIASTDHATNAIARDHVAGAGGGSADLIVRVCHPNAVKVGHDGQSVRPDTEVIAEHLVALRDIRQRKANSIATNDVAGSRSQPADAVARACVNCDSSVIPHNIGAGSIGADEVAFDHIGIRTDHAHSCLTFSETVDHQSADGAAAPPDVKSNGRATTKIRAVQLDS